MTDTPGPNRPDPDDPDEPTLEWTPTDAPPRPNVVQISTYTPPPGADAGIRSQTAYGGPVVFARRVRPWRALLLVVVVAGLLGVGGVWVYNAVRKAQDKTAAESPTGSTPVTSTTVVDASSTTVAPPTLPTGNLFDASAAGLIGPAVEAAAPGDPTKFTSLTLYPTYAVATVSDPADKGRTIRVTIRGSEVVADEPVTQAMDVTPALFTTSDVDWSKVAPLVAGAPATADAPADVVDHVVVLRWGFDPTFPMRVLVYLSGGRFVEAATDGTVVAVH